MKQQANEKNRLTKRIQRKISKVWKNNAIQRWISEYKKYGSLWNYRHGFYKETMELSGITKSNYTNFLDDRRYEAGHPYNRAFSSIIDNKIYLPYLLKDYPDYAPQYYYFINRGRVLSMNKMYNDGFQSFLDLLDEKKKLVIKQCYWSFGKGFYLIEKGAEKDRFLINKVDSSLKQLQRLVRILCDCVCTEYVQQHEYSANVCSTSVNTIRFLCVRDEESGFFYLARCLHRFGVEGSIVDNLGGGGRAYLFFVDIESGTLKENGMYALGEEECYSAHVEYPDNKAYMGMVIPRFEEVKNKVIEISNSFPFLRYIGWDVAITNDGFKILEANSLTSLSILQREGGYLEDEKLRKFFLK